MPSVEMEAYVHPLEEAQVWGWGGPTASTPDPRCHVSSGLAFSTVRCRQFSLICLLGLIQKSSLINNINLTQRARRARRTWAVCLSFLWPCLGNICTQFWCQSPSSLASLSWKVESTGDPGSVESLGKLLVPTLWMQWQLHVGEGKGNWA